MSSSDVASRPAHHPEPISRAEFLGIMRDVPAPVSVIATRHEGRRAGLAATAWTALTADPPTILVCVNAAGSAHELIVASGRFSLNLLPVGMAEVAEIFGGRRGLTGEARFLPEHWHEGPGGLPILTGAVRALECRIVDRSVIGTHSTLAGEVFASVVQSDEPALLYHQGDFARSAPLNGDD